MSKDEGGWNSSFSEKPVRSRLRRLVDWINLMGAKKVHSLIDKVYKRKNLEMAWEKVKENRGSGGVDGQSLAAFEAQLGLQLARLQRELKEDTYQPLLFRRGTNQESIECSAYLRSMTVCANKRCSIGWNPSSSQYSMMLASDIGEGGQQRMHYARFGRRFKAGRSGSWMRTSETFSGPSITKNFSR